MLNMLKIELFYQVEIETLRETGGNNEPRKSFVKIERRWVREGNMMLDIEDNLTASHTIVNGSLFAEQGATKQYDDLSGKILKPLMIID